MPPKGKRPLITGKNGRPVKKAKVDERYNDPHQILEDKKSPLYADDSNIKVATLTSTKILPTY